MPNAETKVDGSNGQRSRCHFCSPIFAHLRETTDELLPSFRVEILRKVLVKSILCSF